MTVKKIIVKKYLSDQEMNDKEGEYFDKHHYNLIIDEDVDVYKEDNTILCKFRKRVISSENCNLAMDSLRDISMTKHNNRGAPAGILDYDKMNNYVGEWYNTKKFRTYYVSNKTNKVSKHDISNLAPSNVIGYFDRKDRNDPKGLPCRLTAFSKTEVEKWNSCIPLVQEISKLFETLIPDKFANQMNRALLSKEFIIKDTCFSTITVNYSWRTGCHKDKGDFNDGFGNIIVCEDSNNPNKYLECYTGFPQYKICFNVRQGDFLAMDVHEWHCNTDFKMIDSPKSYMKFKDIDYRNNWFYNRMSMVCYLRNNMKNCNDRNNKKRIEYDMEG